MYTWGLYLLSHNSTEKSVPRIGVFLVLLFLFPTYCIFMLFERFFFLCFFFISSLLLCVAVIQCNKTVDCIVCARLFFTSTRWFIRFAFLVPNKSTREQKQAPTHRIGMNRMRKQPTAVPAQKVRTKWFACEYFQAYERFKFDGCINDASKTNRFFLNDCLNAFEDIQQKLNAIKKNIFLFGKSYGMGSGWRSDHYSNRIWCKMESNYFNEKPRGKRNSKHEIIDINFVALTRKFTGWKWKKLNRNGWNATKRWGVKNSEMAKWITDSKSNYYGV